MTDAEVRVTSETGGQKGKKQAQVGALDPKALLEVGKVAGFGAEKYERYNFLKGYDYSLAFDAMMRHALAYWSGEDADPESGLPHMAHAAWHALALIAFAQRGVGTDDRPTSGAAIPSIRLCRTCGYSAESIVHRKSDAHYFEHEFAA